MRKAAISVLVLMFLCAGGVAQTTDPATSTVSTTQVAAAQPTKDAQAVSIVQQALTSMGIGAATAHLDSLATGTLTIAIANAKALPIVLKTKGTDRIRIELQMPRGPYIRITSAGKAIIKKPDGTIKQLNQNNTISDRVRHIPAFSLLAEQANAATEVGSVEYSSVNGQRATVVPLCLPTSTEPDDAKLFRDLTKTKFFIDQQSGMVSKVEYSNFAEEDGGEPLKVETFYSDYRQINGVAVPFRQDTYFDGKVRSLLILDSVAFNIGLPDSDFVLPEGN